MIIGGVDNRRARRESSPGWKTVRRAMSTRAAARGFEAGHHAPIAHFRTRRNRLRVRRSAGVVDHIAANSARRFRPRSSRRRSVGYNRGSSPVTVLRRRAAHLARHGGPKVPGAVEAALGISRGERAGDEKLMYYEDRAPITAARLGWPPQKCGVFVSPVIVSSSACAPSTSSEGRFTTCVSP